jgi:hypothetical protein
MGQILGKEFTRWSTIKVSTFDTYITISNAPHLQGPSLEVQVVTIS